MRLHSVRNHLLYVAPIRLVLGIVWVVAARAAGASGTSAMLAFGGGAFAIVFGLLNDPRRAFLRQPETAPAPPGATYAGPVEQALRAMPPSTVGLAVLAIAALFWEPVLTALLGGITAGLGVAGAMRGLFVDPALWFDRGKNVIYRR